MMMKIDMELREAKPSFSYENMTLDTIYKDSADDLWVKVTGPSMDLDAPGGSEYEDVYLRLGSQFCVFSAAEMEIQHKATSFHHFYNTVVLTLINHQGEEE